MVFITLCLIDISSVFVHTWRVQVSELQHKRQIVSVGFMMPHIYSIWIMLQNILQENTFVTYLSNVKAILNVCIGHKSMEGVSVHLVGTTRVSSRRPCPCRDGFVDTHLNVFQTLSFSGVLCVTFSGIKGLC